MTYPTLMANLDLGRHNTAVLKVTRDLAQRFGARVIGVAGAQPLQIAYGNGYLTGQMIQQQYAQVEAETTTAQSEFNCALTGKVQRLEWRPAVSMGQIADYIADEARAADLIITGVARTGARLETSRHLDIGDLVMRAGRPLLIVPPHAERLALHHVLIGWKDTPVTRRAVLDAMAFLRQAERVSVVEIAPEDSLPAARGRVADVAAWLSGHGIEVRDQALASEGDDAGRLRAIADEQSVDLVVAGAYGHSRLREWVLGGVTRDLLYHPKRCALVSH